MLLVIIYSQIMAVVLPVHHKVSVKDNGVMACVHFSSCNDTFSPIDTPPEVMMTSARLMPSFRALRRSSGL